MTPTGVEDAFARLFAEHGEVGAALVVDVGGERIVDLAGGFADRPGGDEPWRPDTLVNVYSVGKAFAALCALRCVADGLLDLDEPVASVWPEFAVAGKGAITLRDVLAHRAGLPAVRRPLPDGTMLDWAAMTAALAAETPWWPPGTAHGYHVNSFGFLAGEPVRRVTGRSIGEVFRSLVGDADAWIGVPASEHGRVATFQSTSPPMAADPPPEDDPAFLQWAAYGNPPGLSGMGWVNRPAWREAEMPSTNTHASARGVADVYRALLDGRLLPPALRAEAATEQSMGEDLVLGSVTRFGLGFQLPLPERPFGPSPRAFGHYGAGGSVGFCDPDADLAFGYVTNQPSVGWQNRRNRTLVDAVYAAL